MRTSLLLGLISIATLAAAVMAGLAELPVSAAGPAGPAQIPILPRPAVVELFTSQGCSSCPPAEAVLGKLAVRPDVIALAFHVDYWDNEAWHDRYSIPQAVPRQASYVRGLGLSTAFTPQVVIDGRASLVGSNERQILGALPGSSDSVPIALKFAGGAVTIELPEATPMNCDVNLAAYLSSASTAVGGGENSGRTLREYNIVRQFTTLAAWTGSPRRISVPRASLPADADRVAVLLQQRDQGRIVGAAAIVFR